jgi:hypothetical protein
LGHVCLQLQKTRVEVLELEEELKRQGVQGLMQRGGNAAPYSAIKRNWMKKERAP